jgi:predicted nucleic acid-binding Zn ribbon protein
MAEDRRVLTLPLPTTCPELCKKFLFLPSKKKKETTVILFLITLQILITNFPHILSIHLVLIITQSFLLILQSKNIPLRTGMTCSDLENSGRNIIHMASFVLGVTSERNLDVWAKDPKALLAKM